MRSLRSVENRDRCRGVEGGSHIDGEASRGKTALQQRRDVVRARLADEFAQHCRIALAAGAAVEEVPERPLGRSGDESDERDQNPDEEHREERGGRDHYCGRERLLVLVEDDVFQVLHVRGVVAARFERFDRARGAR